MTIYRTAYVAAFMGAVVISCQGVGWAEEQNVKSWLCDAGHFFQRQPALYANNPAGLAFAVTVHRHVWKTAEEWANGGDFKIRVFDPAGTVKADGSIPSGAGEAVLRVPTGTNGVYTIEIKPSGYGLFWVECTLPQMVAESPVSQGSQEGQPNRFQLHAMVPRRWYFHVPAGIRRFQVRHVILTSQTHREDYGFFVMNPRGQRVDALFGGKSLDMNPTSGSPGPGFTQRLVPVPVSRTVEVDPGTDGRFWSIWATDGDSHNFSDLNIMLDGVPPYFAPSPEQWFDPRTGDRPVSAVYDETVIRMPDDVDEQGKVSEPYPRYFCTPSTFLGDEDYNGWRGAHSVWLLNPENRKIEFGVQTYLASPEELARPIAVKVTAPDKANIEETALARGKSLVIPAAGAGVYRVDCDGPRWFPWTHPVSPIVMQGRPMEDGGSLFALETGTAKHWFFMVPTNTSRFKVAVTVRDPRHVLRVEVHAPDRIQEELAVRGGVRREFAVPVEPRLAGRIWFIRTEVGSATRFVSGKGNPTQVDIDADIELHGVPGYLAPTWEQWFDPERAGK